MAAFRFSEICFISGFWEKRRFVFNFKIKVRAVGTAGVGERRQSRPVAARTPALGQLQLLKYHGTIR